MFSKLLCVCFLVSLSSMAWSQRAPRCLKNGEFMSNFNEGLKCCDGLEVQPGPIPGVSAKCVKNLTCIGAGDAVGNYPGALQCCAGLDLIAPPAYMIGSAGICRKKSNVNVNDSLTPQKDGPLPGQSVDSSNSSTKQ